MDSTTTRERYGSPWLTVTEAAAYASCRTERIRALVHTGELAAHPGTGCDPGDPSARMGRSKVLINKRDIDALIERDAVAHPLAEALGMV